MKILKNNKNLMKLGNYIKDLFKIDENERASTIMALLLITTGIGIWSYITSSPHTIDSNFVTLILGLGGYVMAINLGNAILSPTPSEENKEQNPPQD